MANNTLSDFPVLTNPDAASVTHVQKELVDYQVTLDALMDYITANAKLKTYFDTLYAPIAGPFLTQNVVTGSRAIDGTVYHNTTGKTMFVNVTIALGASGGFALAYTDSSATPSVQVGEIDNYTAQAGAAYNISFMVLNNNYYKITKSGTCSIINWIEWH